MALVPQLGRAGAAPAVDMGLVEHLGELRDRILKSLAAVAVAVGAVACWFLYPAIFDVLLEPYCNQSERR